MSKSFADILRAARAKIEKPECWTQGDWAKSADGGSDPIEGSEVCWCAEGAIYAACGYLSGGVFFPVLRVLHDVVGCSVPDFNDTHTHAEVLAAFDRAIAAAEDEP